MPSHICRSAGSLGWPAYARFGGWMVLSVLVYCCYSVHGADARQHALANLQRSGCAPGRRRSRAYAFFQLHAPCCVTSMTQCLLLLHACT